MNSWFVLEVNVYSNGLSRVMFDCRQKQRGGERVCWSSQQRYRVMMVMVLGVDLCRSVTIQLEPAIKLDGERRFMNERDHRCKGNSDDGEAV